MYLLDTNIASLFDPKRSSEAGTLIGWLRRHDPLLHLSTITIAEVESGILKLRRERKDQRAAQVALLRDGLIADFKDRILPLDIEVAITLARLQDNVRPNVLELADLIIAATAMVHGLTVLTRNVRHFAPTGVPVIDPLRSLPLGG